jgi:WhiB family redox-sensing transcriptional regulator
MDDAKCAEVAPDIFFPEFGNNHTRQAVKICEECPVRLICLEYALTNEESWGIWGGLTPGQRRRLRRARK